MGRSWGVRSSGPCRIENSGNSRSIPRRTADEDENLVGAGSLVRGQPISRFFETLEYRVTNPEGDLPEVPGRRPNGGVSGACANTPSRQRSRGCREADAEGRTVRATTEQAKAGKGKAPGRRKPRRARRTKARRDAESSPQRDRGSKPLQRGRAGPAVRAAAAITDGPSMIRIDGTSEREPDDNRTHALKPKGQGGRYGPGRREPPNGDAVR
jgi:hypothetical protein